MPEKNKIKDFTDLKAWQKGHELVIRVYEITKKFPRSEQYGLVNQLRRATVSITSNIAEGFSRGSYKDKNKFYYMALGSLTEVQNQLAIAKDIKYIEGREYDELKQLTIEISKIINGLIKSSQILDT